MHSRTFAVKLLNMTDEQLSSFLNDEEPDPRTVAAVRAYLKGVQRTRQWRDDASTIAYTVSEGKPKRRVSPKRPPICGRDEEQ